MRMNKKLLVALSVLGVSFLLSSCAPGAMRKVMNNGAVAIKIAPTDTLEKKLGDVTFKVEPTEKTFNRSYASRDNVKWNVTIKNDCSRVYRTKDTERQVWVADKPFNWKQEVGLGYYGNIGEYLDPLTSIEGMEVVPHQSETTVLRFIRVSSHLKYAWPQTIKIGFYDLPICKDGKYTGEVGNLEWLFKFDDDPFADGKDPFKD